MTDSTANPVVTAETSAPPGEEPPAPAATETPQSNPEYSAIIKKRVDQGAYRFCTDPDYRFFKQDKDRICPHQASLSENCPALARACGRPAWEEEKSERSEPWFRMPAGVGEFLGGALHFVFWALIAAALVFLVREALRRLKLSRADLGNPVGVHRPELSQAATIDARGSSELLALGERALAEGKTREAVHFTYRGLIVALGEALLIRPHKSKTTFDYLRELKGDTKREVSELAKAMDRSRFADHEIAPSEGRQFLDQAKAFVARLTQASATLCVLLCLSACEGTALPEAPSGRDGPQGHGLFLSLLRGLDVKVVERIRRVTSIDPDTAALIALEPQLRELEWQTVQNWVEDGGHLVLIQAPRGEHPLVPAKARTEACSEAIALGSAQVTSLQPVDGFSEASISGNPILRCGNRVVAYERELGSGTIVHITSSTLFWNDSLLTDKNAERLMPVLGELSGRVEVLGLWTGSGAENPLESLTRSGLRPWALHLLAALLVYAWARGRRFGSPRLPSESPRRAFMEHVTAVGLHYKKAHASGIVLQRYAEWLFEILKRKIPSQTSATGRRLGLQGRSSGEADDLSRTLTLARRATQLTETETAHLVRFRKLIALQESSLKSHKRTSKK